MGIQLIRTWIGRNVIAIDYRMQSLKIGVVSQSSEKGEMSEVWNTSRLDGMTLRIVVERARQIAFYLTSKSLEVVLFIPLLCSALLHSYPTLSYPIPFISSVMIDMACGRTVPNRTVAYPTPMNIPRPSKQFDFISNDCQTPLPLHWRAYLHPDAGPLSLIGSVTTMSIVNKHFFLHTCWIFLFCFFFFFFFFFFFLLFFFLISPLPTFGLSRECRSSRIYIDVLESPTQCLSLSQCIWCAQPSLTWTWTCTCTVPVHVTFNDRCLPECDHDGIGMEIEA